MTKKDILVITEHLQGQFQDITYEILGKAKALSAITGGQCIAIVFGSMKSQINNLAAADKIILVDTEDDFNPDVYSTAVMSITKKISPKLVLVGFTSMGLDIAATVGTTLELPIVSHCSEITNAAEGFSLVSRQYGGKINIVVTTNEPTIALVLTDSFNDTDGRISGNPPAEEFSIAQYPGQVRFKSLIIPKMSDVDITKSEVLVALGRGAGGYNNIQLAEQLAELLNADIACSRPLVDAGWLPKTRQVGKSGNKVGPAIYIALGISGAPEHVEGIKKTTTVIAVNTDANAPIFEIARYGMIQDLKKVCQELVAALKK